MRPLRVFLASVVFVALVATASVSATPNFNAWDSSFPIDGLWCIFYGCSSDFAVIGAGPSGATLAATLAKELPGYRIRSVTDGTPYQVEQEYSWTWFWNDTQNIPSHIKDIPYNTPHWTVEGSQVRFRSQYWPQCKVEAGCQMFNGGVCQAVTDDYWNQVAALLADPFFLASNVNQLTKWYENYKISDPTNRHGHSGNLVMRNFPVEPAWFAALTSAMSSFGDCPILADTNGGTSGIGYAARNVDVNYDGSPIRQTAYDKILSPYLNDGTGKHTKVNLATVTKVIFHPIFSNRAIGYTYIKDGREVNEYVRREVILSTGNLQDAKLLYVSGVGPAAKLAADGIPLVFDSPQVGRNLMNEIVWNLVASVPFAEPRYNGSGTVATWRSSRAIARGDTLADCMISFVRLAPGLMLFGLEQLRYDSRGKSIPINGDYHQEWSTSFDINTDVWNTAPGTSDMDVQVEITQRGRAVIALVGGTEVSPGQTAVANTPAAIKAWLPGVLDTNYHHHNSLHAIQTPTTASPTAAATGVLDSNFNVIGTKGLRVVSNSFGPIQQDAHTSQHIAMRLGALGGAKIAQDY